MRHDVTVVIRSCRERTVPLCRELLKLQVPEDSIHTIEVSPFSAAVRKTFELGLADRKKWTLAVDGDVLLYPGAVEEHVRRALTFGPKLYSYQGHIKDKIFGNYRGAGLHLFNNKYLDKGLAALEVVKDSLRPESGTYRELAKQGYITIVDKVVYALHDYHQHYEDLFRKAYFHSKKHAGSGSTIQLMTNWRKHVAKDDDFKVLFYGWAYGCSDCKPVINDRDFFKQITAAEFPKIGLKEKDAIHIDTDHWTEILQRHKEDSQHQKLNVTRLPRTWLWQRTHTVKSMVKQFRLRKSG